MHYVANHIRLNVLERGSGPTTLALLHYFGGSALEWQAVMDSLADTYRCVAVDLRGQGDSEAPATDYSVDDMADDVAALLRVLNVNQYVLVGHSMSGKVALALASRRPAGLQSLVLVSPSPPLPEPIPDAQRQQMLVSYGQRRAAEATVAQITAKPLSDADRQQIIADNLRTSEAAWNAWLTLGSRETIRDRMATVDVPVAIIVGTDDRAIAPAVQTEMTLPYLKTATLDTVDGAGHLLPWETPDELTRFIRKKVGG